MSPQCLNSLRLYAGNPADKIQKLLNIQAYAVKKEMCEFLGCNLSSLAEALSNTPNIW